MRLDRRNALFLAMLLAAGSFAFGTTALAQGVDMAEFARQAGFSVQDDLRLVIARLIRTAISFAGIVVTCFVLYGGFAYMTAAGDATRVATAKKILTNAFVGLFIVLASFAITQFVVGQLATAIGAPGISGSGGGGGGGFYGDGGGAGGAFTLLSGNAACASSLRNFRPQLVFSHFVDAASVNAGGIVVRVPGGAAVPGSFVVSGKKVSFVPDLSCGAPNASERCFPADTDVDVELSSAILKSTSGRPLSCTVNFPCSLSMRTGSLVDASGPTLAMDAPDDGAGAIVSDVVLLQSRAVDDTGVSTVEFLVDGVSTFVSSLAQSAPDPGEPVSAGADKFFFTDATEWDTAGFSTNRTYRISANGSDCAGHESPAAPVSLVLRAATCGNGTQDAGETGADCGGTPSSSDYCGACVAAPCTDNSQCASGMCEAGACVAVARVDQVRAGDGAVGNLVTVSGIGFGTTPGAVTFLGRGSDPDVRVTDFSCGGSVAWGEREVVVRVPAGATDGPILLETAGNLLSDRTDDAFGPFVADFDVNGVVRPGLCSASPESGARGSAVTLSGTNLGSAQGSGTVYFGQTQAAGYRGWADASAVAVSPALDARAYGVQAFVGDNVCADDLSVACRADSDCASGECLMRRQGSNPVTFMATSASAASAPNLATLDTGRLACASGTRCAADADCGGAQGSCAATPGTAPTGQYVTLSGSAFGTGTGQVIFRNVSSGQEAVADTDFPDACGEQYWRDGSVTVKVPSAVRVGGSGLYGDYEASVKRAEDGARSNALPFAMLDPAQEPPGPSLCAIDPVSGPAGTFVSFFGEHFGAAQGSVLFTGATASALAWADRSVSGAIVPGSAQTGPASVRSAAGLRSNGIPFSVADCRDDANACAEGTACCADGTCAVACSEPVVAAHYAYGFSTGPIPKAPRLLYQCDPAAPVPPVPSPSPWEGHSEPSQVCLNAAVSGTFDLPIDPATVTLASVKVEQCTGPARNPCSEKAAVAGSVAPNAVGFMWTPSVALLPDATYEVTLLGGDAVGAIASLGTPGAPSAPLLKDEAWRFRTAPAGTVCVPGSVSVSPQDFTARAQGEEVGYQSLPVANGCVTLSCVGTTFDWGAAPSRATLASAVVADSCQNVATALQETNPGAPVIVSAAARVTGTPRGTGDLTVNFTDPQVVSHSPACEDACVNAAIVGIFNIPMREGDVEAPGAVRALKCVNALCAGALTPVAASAAYDEADLAAPRFTVSDAALLPNSFYRVVVSGSVRSKSGVPLSVAVQDDLRYGTDVSWTFKTKDSAVTCAIDRVDVSPKEAVATFVGQRKEFRARPFGAPDSCSANGQELGADDFSWAPWTATDRPDTVPAPVSAALMIGNGAITLGTPFLPAGCTGSCLATGTVITTQTPLCGNGRLDPGEDCDGALGCSATTCLHAGANRTTDPAAGSCGNGTVEAGEECDDVNATDGDGCSSRCLNEGSRAVGGGARCGNGSADQDARLGGEDCDDGNASSGDGCSSECLNEGSIERVGALPVCGDGTVTRPAESCDGGNALPGDGCSERCLNEGTNAPLCGNGTLNAGEDCDDGNAATGDGCSARCLLEGSSIGYATASFCGDGVTGVGEAQPGQTSACEAAVAGRTRVGPYAVAQASVESPREIDAPAKEAVATVAATAGTPPKSGTASFAVQCSCQSDAMCGVTATLGCGAGSCCFIRPSVGAIEPAQGATNVCRNALVQVDFDQDMQADSFDRTVAGGARDPRLYLELTELSGSPVTAATCPHGALASGPMDLVNRAWAAIRSFFGTPASAQAAASRCLVPVGYQAGENPLGGDRVTLALREPLAKNGTYRVVVTGDVDLSDATAEGVLGENGVSLAAGKTQSFTTGSDLCAIDRVEVIDLGRVESLAPGAVTPKSAGLFTRRDELHRLQAQAQAVRQGLPQPIQPIPGTYAWSWSFSSTIPAGAADVVVTQVPVPSPAPNLATAVSDARALGLNGEESAIAQATVTADTQSVPSTVGRAVGGEALLTVMLCENPWPALDDPALPFPYAENGAPNPSNYSFFYCRDAGEPGTADDLPALRVQPTAVSPVGALKEILYPVEGERAGVGVRVIANPRYLPPDLWYSQVGGFGGSPQPASVDGYEAVRDGNTIYVAAANQSGDIYPNVYVLSVSDGAPEAAAAVLDQVASHWRFNANAAVTDLNLCRVPGGAYARDAAGELVRCEWDGDCVAEAGQPAQACDAEKAKLRRDMRRLTDLVRIRQAADAYGASHAHCSVTKNQACVLGLPSCPGQETCVKGIPELAEGTFVRTLAVSAWPSWNATLGAALGRTLPEDPLNEFFRCAEGADPATCYDASQGQFACARGSHVYGYESFGGESYVLSTVLEHAEAPWSAAIRPKACAADVRRSCLVNADCPSGECVDDPQAHLRAEYQSLP